MVYGAGKVHVKDFVQNWLVKISLFYVQATTGLCCYCQKLWFFKIVTTQGNASSWNALNLERPTHHIENII